MDHISEKKCAEIHDQAKSNDYWHDINAYRREAALSLLQTAKEKDMSLYVALKAIYPNATIKNWKKADYKFGRDTMLTLCVLQRFSITDANKFLVETMRSYPIHTRNPEEAAFYYVIRNSKTILQTLHYDRLLQNEKFLEKLNEKKGGYSGGRTSYKKERTDYHINKEKALTESPVYVVNDETILKYIYDFLSCTNEQRDEAIARIILAMYSENLVDFIKQKHIILAKPISNKVPSHTSHFTRGIEECHCEQEFLAFLDKNSESLGMARLSVYREIKDIIWEQARNDADENRFRFYQRITSLGKKYGFLLYFQYKNHPKPTTHLRQSDISRLISVEVILSSHCSLTKKQIRGLIELYDDHTANQDKVSAELLCHIDGLFGFAIANCYISVCREENAGRENRILTPIPSSYRALNTVVHQLLGLEWKNHHYHHHTVNQSKAFRSVIHSVLVECGLNLFDDDTVDNKGNVLDRCELMETPQISLSRSLILLHKLKELIFNYINSCGNLSISHNDCLKICEKCDEHLKNLGFAPLAKEFYPDRTIREKLGYEKENSEEIDARTLWATIQEDLSNFTDEVYSYEYTQQVLQITNQVKKDKRSSLKMGTTIRSTGFVYRIEKEISRGSSSIVYLADMSPKSSSDQIQLVLVKEAYPYEAGELRSAKQILESIPKTKEMLFKEAKNLLQKEFDMYATLQRNEGSLLRQQYQASNSDHRAAQQPVDFLMETIELFHSEETETSFFSMKTFRGKTLDAYSEQLKKASFEAILDIFKKIVSAVDHLHKRNVLHLDLKPDNIFITDSNSIKLIDLNAACFIDDGPCFTSISQFSPPEAMIGKCPDKTADTYSLMAILNWMLLQNGDLLADKGYSVTTPINLLSQYVPCLQTIPYQDIDLLKRIIRYGLNQQVERRFSNTSSIIEYLEHVSTIPHKIESNNKHESVVRIVTSIMLYKANNSADHFAEALMSLIKKLIDEKGKFSVDETAAFITTIDTQYLFKGRPDVAFWGYDTIDQLHTIYPKAFPLRSDDLMQLVGRLYNCATQTASNRAKEYERRLFQVPVDSVLQQIDAANKLLNMYEENFRFQEAFSEGVELIQQLEQLRQPIKQNVGILSRFSVDNQNAYQKIYEVLSRVLSKNAQQLAYQGLYREAKERFDESLNTPTTEGNRALTISYAFHAAVSHAVLYKRELHDERLAKWAKELFQLSENPDFSQNDWFREIEQKIQFDSNKDILYNVYGFMKLLWAVQKADIYPIDDKWFKKLSNKVIKTVHNSRMKHLIALTAQYGYLLANKMELSQVAMIYEHELRELSIPNGVAGIIVATAKTVCAPESIPWQESELYTLLKHYIETADTIDEDQRESYQAIKQYFEKTIESKKGTISLIRYLYA